MMRPLPAFCLFLAAHSAAGGVRGFEADAFDCLLTTDLMF